jgi:hypothetical protein
MTRGQITTTAPGREARQARYKQTDQFLDVAERFLLRDQLPSLLSDTKPQLDFGQFKEMMR